MVDAPAPALRQVVLRTCVDVVFAAAAAALLVKQIGYGFEVGDQLQYLLLPYRQLIPDFLPGDWFTWQTSHYHATFAWVVQAIHALAGEAAFPRGMFVAHALNLAWFGYALVRLARAVGLGVFEAAVALLGFACVRQIGLGGAVLNHAALVPADLALAPCLLACAAFAERRVLAVGVWLGVAGLIHANYAVLGPLLLFPLEVLQLRRRTDDAAPPLFVQLLRLAMAVGLFAMIASPTLFVTAQSFLARDSAPGAVALTLFVRSPHHYDLGVLRLDEFYFALVLGLAALPHALGQVGPSAGRREHLLLTAAMLAIITLGVIGTALHVLALARVFTFRLSLPLFTLWWLAAGRALRELARTRRWVMLAWLSGLFVVLTSFAQTDPLEGSPWTLSPKPAAYGCGLLLLASAAGLWRGSPQRARRAAQIAVTTLATGLAVVLAWSVVHSAYWLGPRFVAPRGLHFLDGQIVVEPRTRPLYAAIRERTAPDARFLVPPSHSQFRLQARRAIFVDWKCTPMKGDEALEWQRRMLLAMGVTEFPARGYGLPRAADIAYNARSLIELAELARREGLTHVLARRERRPVPPSLRRSFESGGYVVYELVP
ncbi:MAG: DUF6798 domain-containing protein [Polyangiales bacterium]